MIVLDARMHDAESGASVRVLECAPDRVIDGCDPQASNIVDGPKGDMEWRGASEPFACGVPLGGAEAVRWPPRAPALATPRVQCEVKLHLFCLMMSCESVNRNSHQYRRFRISALSSLANAPAVESARRRCGRALGPWTA